MADDVAGSSALEVSADGSGFVAQLDRMTKAAETFERRAVQSAGKAGAAASGIGDGAEKAAVKADAASKRFTAAVEREIAALTLSRSEYRKWQAQQQGISESVYGPLIAKLDAAKRAQDATTASVGRLGTASELTGRQTRLLGRQVADVVGALGAGTGVLGDVAGRLGSTAAAFGGLGAAVRLLTNPITLVVGAAVAAGVAFKEGKAESDAYARALILSGNAAGTTVGQLDAMARAQAAVAGSQGEAAAVLAQLAASGAVVGAELSRAAAAALRFERAGGGAASETAKKFIELGKDPLKALVRLNEAENFLTRSVFESVRALEERGRKTEAATAAQNAYADALQSRAGQLEPRLGTLEKAWQGVTDQAKRAWNAMLNIGREDTLEEKLEQTRAQIETQRRRLAGLEASPQAGNLGLTGGGGAASARAAIQSLRDRESAQQSDLRLFRQAAERQRQGAAEIKARIAADAKQLGAGAGRDVYADLTRELDKLAETQRQQIENGGEISEVRKLEIKLADDLAKASGKLTAAQREDVKAKGSAIVAQRERLELLRAEAAIAQVVANTRSEARQRESAGIAAFEQQQRDAADQAVKSLRDRAQGLEDEEKAVALAAAQNITLAQAIEQVAIARLQEQRARFNDTDEGRRAKAEIDAQIAQRERIISALGAKGSREAADKSAKEFQQAYERAYDQLSQGLTDALIAGGKSAAEYLKGLFRNLVLRPLLQPFVGPIAGVLAGTSLGASAQGAAAQGAFGQAQQASTLFQAGQTIYQGFASGFSGVGGTAAGLFDAAAAYSGSTYGTAFGSQQSAMLAAQDLGLGGGATTGGTAFGSVASTAAGAAVGIYGGRAISGGYSAIGGSGNTAVNVGTAIGAIWGPIGAAVGGAIGGIVNRAFGRRAPEVTGRGIEGTITGSNFSGSTVTDVLEKGGLFRSDRRSQISEAITGDLDKALDEGAKSLSDLAAKYGAALGLPAENLAGVTAQIKVKITDNAEENSKAIAEALQQYADALLGSFAADVEPFRRSGETVAQTIERVGGTLLTVNQSLEQLGIQALATSIDGGKAATALADLFGDAGTFAQASASYYSKFYTEAERAGKATEQITETLADLGLSLPATRDDFRALVEAQDLTTDSGRQAFAALLGVSDAFDALRTAAGDSAQALAEVVQQRKDLETQLLELQGNTVELRNRERDALDESNRALFDQIKALEDQAEATEKATEAAKEAARVAERQAQRDAAVTRGADAIIGDFLSGDALIRNRATRINEILTEGGITGGTIEGIIGSTREDIVRLWNSVGTAGREAILDALSLWEDLDELVNGTARAVSAFRSGSLADQIEQARLGSLSPQARLAELRRQEAAGFAGLGSAADPVAAAQRLSTIIGQRVALETQLAENRGDALRKELEAVERIRDVAQDAVQAAAQMKFDDLSSLSRRDQLGAARALFDTTVARARAGDENALGNLVGNAAAFRQEARTAFASSPAFAAIDALVTGTLESFGFAGAGAASRATEIQQQLDALDGIDASLGESGALYQALLRIDGTLAAAFAANPAAATTATGAAVTGTAATAATSSTTLPTATTTVAGADSQLQVLRDMLAKLGRLDTLVTRAEQSLTLDQDAINRTVAGLAGVRESINEAARTAALNRRSEAAARV